MPILTRPERDTLNQVSANLGVNPPDLERLIQFESKWNPFAKNPYSSARGLIQIIDSSSRGLGYTSSLDAVQKNPSRSLQLKNIVYPYLRRYIPFKDKKELAMSVFLPEYRHKPVSTVLPLQYRKQNPGINTMADYLQKVYPGLYYNILPKLIFLGVIAFLSFNAFQKGGTNDKY